LALSDDAARRGEDIERERKREREREKRKITRRKKDEKHRDV